MKMKLVLTGIMATILLVTGACATAQGGTANKLVTVDIGNDELNNNKHITKQVAIAKGGTLTVILASNPATGFGWNEQAQIGNAAV